MYMRNQKNLLVGQSGSGVDGPVARGVVRITISKTVWGLERYGQEGQLLDDWDLSRGTLGPHVLLETHTLAKRMDGREAVQCSRIR